MHFTPGLSSSLEGVHKFSAERLKFRRGQPECSRHVHNEDDDNCHNLACCFHPSVPPTSVLFQLKRCVAILWCGCRLIITHGNTRGPATVEKEELLSPFPAENHNATISENEVQLCVELVTKGKKMYWNWNFLLQSFVTQLLFWNKLCCLVLFCFKAILWRVCYFCFK